MKSSKLLYLLILLFSCGKNPSSDDLKLQNTFIEGGVPVIERKNEDELSKEELIKKDPFPSVVAISRRGEVICTGNIYAKTKERARIITAAHCVADISFARDPRVLGQLKFKVDKIYERESKARKKRKAESKKMGRMRILEEVLVRSAKKLKAHVGPYATENMKGKAIWVKDAWFTKDYLKYAYALIYGGSYMQYMGEFNLDKLILEIEVNESIENIKVIPLMSKKEYRLKKNDVFSVVGLGAGFSSSKRKELELKKKELRAIQAEFENEKNEANKRKLRNDYAKADRERSEILEEGDQFGVKTNAFLKVKSIENGNIISKKRNGVTGLEGPCGGDSGAPYLIKLKNGEYRQVAVHRGMNGEECGGNVDYLAALVFDESPLSTSYKKKSLLSW